MKKFSYSFLLLFLLLMGSAAFGQKIMSEGTVTYDVSVISGKDQPGIADAFDGATLTVYMKGNQVRTDLRSNLRSLSIFYSAKDRSAVMLKESGKEKYMINLTPQEWNQYNKKTDGIQFDYQDDTRTIAGHPCKKAVGTMRNGNRITVYYATDLKALYPGYEDAFSSLPGLPLQYELTTGSIVVRYTATSIQTAPVIASKFDLPRSGYKILEYRQ